MRNLLFISLLIIPFLVNCKNEGDSDSISKEKNQKTLSAEDTLMQVREIAWNSLSYDAKSSVIIDWKKAGVYKSANNEISCYFVTFNTNMDPLLGPIGVYVDYETKTVLGYALRD